MLMLQGFSCPLSAIKCACALHIKNLNLEPTLCVSWRTGSGRKMSSSDRSHRQLNVNLVSPQSVIVASQASRPRTSSHPLAGLVVATPVNSSMTSIPNKSTEPPNQ